MVTVWRVPGGGRVLAKAGGVAPGRLLAPGAGPGRDFLSVPAASLFDPEVLALWKLSRRTAAPAAAAAHSR